MKLRDGEALAQLRENDLRGLAGAIRTGRICFPFSVSSLSRIVGSQMAGPVAAALQSLTNQGCGSDALAFCVEMLSDASSMRPSIEDSVQLVMTAPTQSNAYHRDTKVVVADLFRRAEKSVLIAGYAVHQGKQIFEELASRMEKLPSLNVRAFLNLPPRPGNALTAPELVSRFVSEFSKRHWPAGHRLPEVYYDRRGIEAANNEPISLHAKCVVLDEQELFVSSANFTEAAQNRNIEMGVLLISPPLARQATQFFTDLIREGVCLRAI